MKTLFISLFSVVATVSFAQLAGHNPTPSPITSSPDDVEIVYEQLREGDNGAISGFYNNIEKGIYSADDFELAENTKITSITAYGFQLNGTLEDLLTGVKVYIFSDNSKPVGIPDTDEDNILHSFEIEAEDPALNIIKNVTNYDIVVDLNAYNLTLPAGRYWLSITPQLNEINDIVNDANNRWLWYQSSLKLSLSHIVDPNLILNVGLLSSWLPTTSVGLSVESFAFTIKGEQQLGVNDLSTTTAITVYPNPSSDIINIKLDNGLVLKEVQLLDSSGRSIKNAKNSNIDVSNLPTGVYLVRVITTNNKIIQTKVVIK